MYINLLDGVIAYRKRCGKSRKRKRPHRGGLGAHTDSSFPTLSSPSSASDSNALVHLGSPTSQNSDPGPSTTSLSGSRDLTDLNTPVSSPGENINGLKATMNINLFFSIMISKEK